MVSTQESGHAGTAGGGWCHGQQGWGVSRRSPHPLRALLMQGRLEKGTQKEKEIQKKIELPLFLPKHKAPKLQIDEGLGSCPLLAALTPARSLRDTEVRTEHRYYYQSLARPGKAGGWSVPGRGAHS